MRKGRDCDYDKGNIATIFREKPICIFVFLLRRIWSYQRGNQNPYIEEQTTQWPKEKVQKDKQRSTKHTYKTKDRTPLKTGGTQVLPNGKQFLLH
jgi:hypothetical protein